MHIMNGLVQWYCNLPGSKTYWQALLISSKWILCITTEGLIGLIPLILAIFQPIASLCPWSILTNWCSQKSSNFGGSTIDRSADEGSRRWTTFGCQLLVLKREIESNDALTKRDQLIFQYPNCDQKGVKQASKGSSQLDCMKVSWTRLSIMLTSHLSSFSGTCLLMSKILSSTVIFPKEIFITPLWQLIKALDVAKKGRPKMTWICVLAFNVAQCLTQQNQQENRMHPP